MRSTKKTSPEPWEAHRQRTPWQLLRKSLRRWDTCASAVFGLVVGALSAVMPLLSVGSAPLTAAIPACLACFGIATTWATKLSDDSLVDFLGQMVRVFDPRHASLFMPYRVVALVSFFAASFNLVGVILIVAVPQALAALLYGVSAWLTSWSLLSLFDLYLLNERHKSRRAEMRSIQETLQSRRQAPENEIHG